MGKLRFRKSVTPQGHTGLKTEKSGIDTLAPASLSHNISSSPQLKEALRHYIKEGETALTMEIDCLGSEP